MTPIPHVIHLVISLAPGGLERLVVDWTNARNKRHPGSTLICCLDERGALASQVESNAVVCLGATRSRKPFDVVAVRNLRQLLSTLPSMTPTLTTQQPNNSTTVLHSHNAAAWQYGVLACLGKSIRHVHTEHGTNPHGKGLINRLRNAWLWRCTSEVVAVADPVAESLSQVQGVPGNRIRVIPNGIETVCRTREQGNEVRVKHGIPAGATVIGSVGRLAHVKGHDRLISAFSRMTTHNLILLLVGDGPERTNLERQARELRLSDRVIFAGYQANPWPYYSAMDLFILPSRSEGLSISLLEAMAAGTPVAVTDVGENRVVLDKGQAGTLLQGDEAEWAAALTALLTDPLRDERVAAAKNRVNSRYSLESTLDGYERLYS